MNFENIKDVYVNQIPENEWVILEGRSTRNNDELFAVRKEGDWIAIKYGIRSPNKKEDVGFYCLTQCLHKDIFLFEPEYAHFSMSTVTVNDLIFGFIEKKDNLTNVLLFHLDIYDNDKTVVSEVTVAELENYFAGDRRIPLKYEIGLKEALDNLKNHIKVRVEELNKEDFKDSQLIGEVFEP